jgi:hypothetical protein
MCDYSPHSIRNRLAEEGEDLVLHRFETGFFGFASAADLRECEAKTERASSSIWGVMKDWLLFPRHSERVPTICVPPGAQLLLRDIPAKVQASLCIRGSELAVFTELHARRYRFRDALLLPNATRVLLQDLPEGLHAVVLSMSLDTPSKEDVPAVRAS